MINEFQPHNLRLATLRLQSWVLIKWREYWLEKQTRTTLLISRSQASLTKSRRFAIHWLGYQGLESFLLCSTFYCSALKRVLSCHVLGCLFPRTKSRYIDLFVYRHTLQHSHTQCGITDEDLVTLSVRDLNRQLKMRGLNRDEIVQMKQR